MYQENIGHTKDMLPQKALLSPSSDACLEELLEQAGTELGDGMWDVDGVVFKLCASRGISSLHMTGAWRDGLDSYHGLICRRCSKEVERPATLQGRGYLLGPYHSQCAKEAESDFQREVVNALESAEASP